MSTAETPRAYVAFNFATVAEFQALMRIVNGASTIETERGASPRVRAVAETIADVIDFDETAIVQPAKPLIPIDVVSLEPDYGAAIQKPEVYIDSALPQSAIEETYYYLRERMAA